MPDRRLRRRLAPERRAAVLPRHALVALHRAPQPLDAARPPAANCPAASSARSPTPTSRSSSTTCPRACAPTTPATSTSKAFSPLVALPQYDGGEGLNVTAMLSAAGLGDRPRRDPDAALAVRACSAAARRTSCCATSSATALAPLDRELQVVGEIQRSLLPRDSADDPRLRAGRLLPDQRPRRRRLLRLLPARPTAAWGLFIADVSGHGTPAAVLMAITHAIAHAQPGTHTPPAELLAYLNDQLARSYTRDGTFVTAFYAVLDPARAHAHLLHRRPQPAAARPRRPRPLARRKRRPAAGHPRRSDLRRGHHHARARRPAAALHRRHHRGDGADAARTSRAAFRRRSPRQSPSDLRRRVGV